MLYIESNRNLTLNATGSLVGLWRRSICETSFVNGPRATTSALRCDDHSFIINTHFGSQARRDAVRQTSWEVQG